MIRPSGTTFLGGALLLHAAAMFGIPTPTPTPAPWAPRHRVACYVRHGDFVRGLRMLAGAELLPVEADGAKTRLRVLALGGDDPLRPWSFELAGDGLDELQAQLQQRFGVELGSWLSVTPTDGVRRWVNPEAGLEFVRTGAAEVGTLQLAGLRRRLTVELTAADLVAGLRARGQQVVEVPVAR